MCLAVLPFVIPAWTSLHLGNGLSPSNVFSLSWHSKSFQLHTSYQPLQAKVICFPNKTQKMAKDFNFDDANSTDPSKHTSPPFDIGNFGDMISQFTAGGFGFPGGAPAADDDAALPEE